MRDTKRPPEEGKEEKPIEYATERWGSLRPDTGRGHRWFPKPPTLAGEKDDAKG